MKYIHKSFILLVACALLPFYLKAQTVVVNETDSLSPSTDDQMVQVAFRKVSESNLLGGVSVLNVEELLEKNYYIYSMDNLQGYLGGFTGNSLWGMNDYLILVDGIPRDANNVIPTEIAQISILKGASAVVLYGSRAAKGVIYITTKKGKSEQLSINVRANTGWHTPISYPKYLGSAEYMTLYNEALLNDGKTPQYSDEEIYNYGSGTNPYRYPDVDFYSSDYLKKAINRSEVSTEISGGGERSRYYTNIGYINEKDFLNFGNAADNNISRLNIRGNIDVKLGDKISAYINSNATFYDAKSAVATAEDGENNNYWISAATMRPNRVAPLIPLSYFDENNASAMELIGGTSNIVDNMFLGGTQIDQTNIFADYYFAGTSKWTSRQFQFNSGLDFDLDNLLKGLSFHTILGIDYATSYTTSYNNTYAVYEPSWYNYNGTDVISGLTKYSNDEKDGIQNISGSYSRQTLAFSGYFAYQNSFSGKHNLSALLVANGFQQTISAEYHRPSNANLGFQLGYNYKEKYFADFGSALVYSAKLAEGSRTALSPSLTLGWKLSNEGFLANSSIIDNLMLSASASILNTDLDISEYYLYEANYNQSDGAWWGWYDGASEHSTNIRHGASKDLTFVKRKEFRTSINAVLFDELISINSSYFINSMEGLLIQPQTIYPSYFFTYYPNASFIPYVNFNNDQRAGFDFSVNIKKQLGEVNYTLGFVGTYLTTKATKRDEVNEYAYQNRQGQPIDGIWGLENLGLFQNTDEITNSPEQTFGGTIRPGDIKYKDQNDDDVIDEQDVVYLGRAGWYGAPLTLGVNLTAQWKNLTFFVLGTGNYGAYAMKDNSYFWVYGDRKYSEIVRERWTEESSTTATYPRLTTESGANNFRNSDYWIYKTDLFKLAKVQITYNLPKNLIPDSFISDLSVYVSGSNLATFSKEQEILDMRVASGPRTRFYNVGVKILF